MYKVAFPIPRFNRCVSSLGSIFVLYTCDYLFVDRNTEMPIDTIFHLSLDAGTERHNIEC